MYSPVALRLRDDGLPVEALKMSTKTAAASIAIGKWTTSGWTLGAQEGIGDIKLPIPLNGYVMLTPLPMRVSAALKNSCSISVTILTKLMRLK